MEKYRFNKEQIEKVFDEVRRRIEIAVFEAHADGQTVTLGDIKDLNADVMQGVYSTLMVLSDNWSEVVLMMDEIKRERSGWEEEI